MVFLDSIIISGTFLEIRWVRGAGCMKYNKKKLKTELASVLSPKKKEKKDHNDNSVTPTKWFNLVICTPKFCTIYLDK